MSQLFVRKTSKSHDGAHRMTWLLTKRSYGMVHLTEDVKTSTVDYKQHTRGYEASLLRSATRFDLRCTWKTKKNEKENRTKNAIRQSTKGQDVLLLVMLHCQYTAKIRTTRHSQHITNTPRSRSEVTCDSVMSVRPTATPKGYRYTAVSPST